MGLAAAAGAAAGAVVWPGGAAEAWVPAAGARAGAGAARAVGGANGSNRISIIIPCHRVIAAGGGPGGYSGGLWRKRRLLELESSRMR